MEHVKVCWGPTCFMGAHIAAAVACVVAAVLAVLLWARTVDLYDAVVPDWLKLLARQSCVADSFDGLKNSPARSSKPRATVTRPSTEAKVLSDGGAENDPCRITATTAPANQHGQRVDLSSLTSANHGLVSDSPRSWRTQSHHRRQQQEEEV